MTPTELKAVIERLTLLTQVIGMKEFDHLPIVSRDNAGQFQSDMIAALLAAGVGLMTFPTWKPIAERPMNGEPLLITAHGWKCPIVCDYGLDAEDWAYWAPTHFMLASDLPQPPTTAEEG